MQSPTKIIAVSLALSGFSVALISGLGAGNAGPTTIVRAMFCMFICLGVGRLVGWAGSTAVAEMLDRFRAAHPIPDVDAEIARVVTGETPPEGVPESAEVGT